MKKKQGRIQIALKAFTTAIAGSEVTTSYADCRTFSTQPMVCPLCRVMVPANVMHSCSKSAPKKAARR